MTMLQDPQYTTNSGELSEIPDPEWMTRLTQAMQNMTFTATSGDVTEQETVSYGNVYNENGYYEQQQGYDQYYQQPTEAADAGYASGEHAILNGEQTYTNGEQGYEQAYANGDQVYGTGDQGFGVGDQGYVGEGQEPVETAAEAHPEPPLVEPHSPVKTFPGMFNPLDYGSGAPNNVALPPPGLPPVSEEVPGSRRSSVVDNLSRKPSLSEPPSMDYYSPPQPRSMPPTFPPSTHSDNTPSQPPAPVNSQPPPSNRTTKPESAKKPAPEKAKKSSWLGGIFGKILKAPNQVHLPDDSDKKIVFDEKRGRWVNEGEEEDSCAPAAPPPMDSSFMNPAPPVAAPQTAAVASLAPNNPPVQSFRAPKRRGRGYVDVFGQSGATKPVTAPPLLPGADISPPAVSSPTLFNPSLAPISDEGGAPDPREEAAPSQPLMPMMFNPSSMTSVTDPPAF